MSRISRPLVASLLAACLLIPAVVNGQPSGFPRYDHVFLLIEENEGFRRTDPDAMCALSTLTMVICPLKMSIRSIRGRECHFHHRSEQDCYPQFLAKISEDTKSARMPLVPSRATTGLITGRGNSHRVPFCSSISRASQHGRSIRRPRNRAGSLNSTESLRPPYLPAGTVPDNPDNLWFFEPVNHFKMTGR